MTAATRPDEWGTVKLLGDLLADPEPFVHLRFGDGDVFFATGTGPVLTADGETWTPELGQRLEAAWLTLAGYPGRLLVGDVESYIVSDGCEEQWHGLVAKAEAIRGKPLELVHIEALRASVGVAVAFYAALAACPCRKVYACPDGLAPAAAMLEAEHVPVPLGVAHEHADELTAAIVALAPEIVLLSAGRGGKIVQAQLAVLLPDVKQVDIGSGLDVLFTDLRRGTDGRVDVDRLRDNYRAFGMIL